MANRQSIITLLTDFGTQDYFVAAMKGVILSRNPGARIIDLTHEIPPQDVRAAAFTLLACYKDFPAGTIHLAVVDPGVGSDRRAILIESGKQFFVGPDNGIFSWICEREGNWRAIHLTNEKFFQHPVSETFHGRDIFAPVAAALSEGISVGGFGEEVTDLVRLEALKPTASEGRVEARIVHVDRFGNCITNLTRELIDETAFGSRAKLIINGREITAFHHFFAQNTDDRGELFCTFGSAGFLEIAARDFSAAKILNARHGDRVILILGSGN